MRSPAPETSREQARQHALHLLNTPPDQQAAPGRRLFWLVGIALAICLLLAVGLLLGKLLFSQPAASAVATPPVQPHARSAPGPVASAPTVTAAGFIKAERLSTVSAEITGTVEEIYVQRGDKVKKGDRLASLDGRSLRAQIAALHASQEMVAGKMAQVKARLPRARAQQLRFSQLLAKGYVSQDELDSARADLDALNGEALQYQAEWQHASWQIKASEIDLSRTVIRAPFDGRVVSLDASPGETVSPVSAGGGFTRTGIATIVGLDNFNAEVWLPENQLSKVRLQQPVVLKPDGLPDLSVNGVVSLVSSVVDEQRAAVLVVVKLTQQQPWLKHNMSIQVDFDE